MFQTNKMSLFKSSINDSGNGTINQNDDLNEAEFSRKLPDIEQNQQDDTSQEEEEEEVLNETNLSQNAACKLFYHETVLRHIAFN